MHQSSNWYDHLSISLILNLIGIVFGKTHLLESAPDASWFSAYKYIGKTFLCISQLIRSIEVISREKIFAVSIKHFWTIIEYCLRIKFVSFQIKMKLSLVFLIVTFLAMSAIVFGNLFSYKSFFINSTEFHSFFYFILLNQNQPMLVLAMMVPAVDSMQLKQIAAVEWCAKRMIHPGPKDVAITSSNKQETRFINLVKKFIQSIDVKKGTFMNFKFAGLSNIFIRLRMIQK